jgi:hypothetical protein
LACLCRSNKCAFVVGIHDARVLSGIHYFQKRLAAFVDADCLKMTESIAHEIDRANASAEASSNLIIDFEV